ncbi:hypothetical protein DI396_13880 [Litorivita pollutaquae]|uniref:Flp pilus assembly protein TadG n=1 Tax=Litorivita pollutaquae TaxID=2200892 RepID=A0A2V4N9Q7_9RHOB|nr:pilus assembly protein [Litorivita pollutaquae]PYC46793.1 hypothetical protein DI396_13880 [Litorivita pollutaquae]
MDDMTPTPAPGPVAAISAQLRRFKNETRASVAVETAMILPILFWAFMASYGFFDAYRQRSVAEKAAFTIADMLSRETLNINNIYLNNTHELLGFLTRTNNPQLRVSVVRWDESDDTYKVIWSEGRGGRGGLAEGPIADWDDRLPNMPDTDRLIVVETGVHFKPVFKIGIDEHDMESFVFSRPRFAPQLKWES